jgi:hypothetical protein
VREEEEEEECGGSQLPAAVQGTREIIDLMCLFGPVCRRNFRGSDQVYRRSETWKASFGTLGAITAQVDKAHQLSKLDDVTR